MAKRKTTLLKTKERRDVQSVADFFRQLADKLEAGELVLQRGADEIRVAVPEQVMLGLKVKKKTKRRGLRHRLKIKLAWREGEGRGGLVRLG
jgi:amphi-Trp domain-containing protein